MDAGIISIFIAGISLLASISSTVVVSIINNKHQDKMFRKEFYEKRKYTVIENYLLFVGKLTVQNNMDDQSDLSEWMSEIYMYVPKELWKDIDDVNQKIIESRKKRYPDNKIDIDYIEFCKKFSCINRGQSVKRTRRKRAKHE